LFELEEFPRLVFKPPTIISSPQSRILKLQERSHMSLSSNSRLLRTLASVCLGIALVATLGDRVSAASQYSSPQTPKTSCPHPLDEYGRQTWKPTHGELNRILARHRGWLQQESRFRLPLEAPDAYLDNDIKAFGFDETDVKPAFPDWRREAKNHPDKANLCNANLNVAILRGAILIGADLRGADLVSADLDGAHLSASDLRGADLSHTDLRHTYLAFDYSDALEAMPMGLRLNTGRLAADLRNAKFEGVILSGANLFRADLRGARLIGSDLTNAIMIDVDLTDAKLQTRTYIPNYRDPKKVEVVRMDMRGADLHGARLIGADLIGVDLRDVKLIGADLSGAKLTCVDVGGQEKICTNLRGADLSGARVSNTHLDHVDLTGATYAPLSEPPNPYVAGIQGLATLRAAKGEQIGLTQLRKLFKDAGLEHSEREVTFSIQENVTRDLIGDEQWFRFPSLARLEGILRRIGFGWTTAYGLYPERALGWILLLGLISTPVYMLCMLRPTEKNRVVLVLSQEGIDTTALDSSSDQEPKKVVKATTIWNALGWASYFSLLSAVNIGFQQFTPGEWIRRLQGTEYSLQAFGWVRTVAGVQALVSVYLLAMWVLTQYGRPFG
jgi:uncharacterized protein YjbI with pentapeptide repeats